MNEMIIEEDFLGQLILSPELLEKVVITDECFFNSMNKFIFQLIKRQYKDTKTINMVLLVENYKNLFTRYTPSEIIIKMTDMTDNASPVCDLDRYQETLFNRFIDSQIINVIREYQNAKITREELLDSIHKYENMSINLEDDILSAEEIYHIISSNDNKINFRFKTLSDISDIREHDLVTIAARTGLGKSAFIFNLIEDLSDRYNCLLFNLEMSKDQVYQRLISMHTGIPKKYQEKPATEYQKEQIKEGCKEIAKKRIRIVHNETDIASIRREIINQTKKGHTLVFVDHVGLVAGRVKNLSEYERITSVTRELRQISLKYNCTIFMVSQFKRKDDNVMTKNKEEKRPELSDLKGSGELEQSSTTVLLLYDKYFGQNISKRKVQIDVIIAKNRNNFMAITPLIYNKEIQRYDIPEKEIKDPNSWRKQE